MKSIQAGGWLAMGLFLATTDASVGSERLLMRARPILLAQNEVLPAPYGDIGPVPAPLIASPDAFYMPAAPAASCPQCELYPHVRYKQVRNMHPCATPLIIDVPDPCDDWRDCCPAKCVKVKICVPPCDCAQVRVRRQGRKLIYDFGKYEVEITSIRGRLVVDYND